MKESNTFPPLSSMTGATSTGGGAKVAPIPVAIKESADRLGVDLSKTVTLEMIHRHWKQRITAPENHPDLGGNAEVAILLNTAREQLSRWLEAKEPKLGKHFGGKK